MKTTKKNSLVICRGLPGSGKSFWAKAQIATNKNIVRVNRDDIRTMLVPGYQHGNFRLEDVVTDASQSAVKSALKAGFDAIVDDTNMSDRAVNGWVAIAKEAGVELKFQDFTDVPVETCIQRDYMRGTQGQPWIGSQVIKKMALRTGITQWGKVILCDLDGTLCDIAERRKICTMPNGKVNFNKFHDLDVLATYKVRHDIIKEVNEAKKAFGCKLIIVSGRSSANVGDENKERVLNWSTNWLKNAGVQFDDILMRVQGDMRSDVEVKKEFLTLIGKENVIRVWDDRRQVVTYWRSEGLDVRVCDPNDPINGGDF